MRAIDGMIRAYFTWKRGLGAPGLDPVEQEGIIYADRCSCGSTLRHTTSEGFPVCGLCGENWGMEHAVRLRGTYQRSRRINPEAQLAGWVDIGVVLGAFMQERRQLAEVVLRRIEMGQSLRAVAAQMGHSVRWVTDAEDQGRRDLTSRFQDAGFDIK